MNSSCLSFDTPEHRTQIGRYLADGIEKDLGEFKNSSGGSICFTERYTDVNGRNIACNPQVRIRDIGKYSVEEVIEKLLENSLKSLKSQLNNFYGNRSKIRASRVVVLPADKPNRMEKYSDGTLSFVPALGWVIYFTVEDSSIREISQDMCFDSDTDLDIGSATL